MRRDTVLFKALRARQRPTAQLSYHLEPKDETDPAELEAAKLVTEVIESIPHFQQLKMELLEALWFGKYAVEIAYQWESWRGRQVLTVRDFIPINGDKIRFKWDGTPGFLVYAGYPGSKEYTDQGPAHFVSGREREQYIVHQHEPDDPDWIEGDMAGAVHGVGLRGRLYWFWWLKQQVFALLMNYLERFSNGLTIFYYDAHNPQAKEEAENAAKQQFSQTALLYPRWLMGGKLAPNGVERLEVGTASPALLENLVTDYFDSVMTQAIVGQTLSSDHTGSGGLGGSGVARFQSETLDEIIAYDSIDLQETIQQDLVKTLYRYNAPGVRPGKFAFQIDTPNAKEVIGYAQALYEMGVSLDEDELFDLAKLSKPKPGGGIVSMVGAMQPAAVGQAPQGMPVAGQPGPQDAQGQAMAAPAGYPPASQGAPQATPAMAYNRNGKSRLVTTAPVRRRRLPQRRVVVG